MAKISKDRLSCSTSAISAIFVPLPTTSPFVNIAYVKTLILPYVNSMLDRTSQISYEDYGEWIKNAEISVFILRFGRSARRKL